MSITHIIRSAISAFIIVVIVLSILKIFGWDIFTFIAWCWNWGVYIVDNLTNMIVRSPIATLFGQSPQ